MAKEILRFAQDDNVSSQANLELLRIEFPDTLTEGSSAVSPFPSC